MKKLKHPITAVLLAIIILIILGYNYDIDHSKTPVEYVVSAIERWDSTPKGIFRRTWRLIKNNYVDETCNHQDWDKWKQKYENQISTRADSRVAIESMVASLNDPYTRFLSKDESEEQERTIDSKLQGIGVHITEISGKVIIISVIEDSPAQKYTLKEKDEIIKIDSKAVKGLSLSKVADLIRGEKGTFVKLDILRNGKVLTKNIKREEIKIKTVKYKMLDNNIAYIRITSFISWDTANEFRNALKTLKDAQAFIIDVRGNYGGLLSNAVYISNMFLSKGNIVSIVDRNRKKQTFSAQEDDFITQKPAIILVDEASASASEIFSGAMQDNKRALLVGETTFGKGKVQIILKLPNNSGLNLTIAKYLTPLGRDIDHKGIKPDYKVECEPAGFTKKADDKCLHKAIELLSQEIDKKAS